LGCVWSVAMKLVILLLVVVLVGCASAPKMSTPKATTGESKPPKADPVKLIADPIVEKHIRRKLKMPTGELTKADLEKVTFLNLNGISQLTDVKGLEKLTKLKSLDLGVNQLTNVKGLEKLTQLTKLSLRDNPDLTKAQIAELQKALPKCKITHNAKK